MIWTSDNAAMKNRVISDSIPVASTAGMNISINPVIVAGAAASASGMRMNSSTYTIGWEMIVNIGVNSAMISAIVPIAMTCGISTNEMSTNTSIPCFICFLNEPDFSAAVTACSKAHLNTFLSFGTSSV